MPWKIQNVRFLREAGGTIATRQTRRSLFGAGENSTLLVRDSIRTKAKLSTPQQWKTTMSEKDYELLRQVADENSPNGATGSGYFVDPHRIVRGHNRRFGSQRQGDRHAFPADKVRSTGDPPVNHQYSARYYHIVDWLIENGLNYESQRNSYWWNRMSGVPKDFARQIFEDPDNPICMYEIFRVVVGLDDLTERGQKDLVLAPMLGAMGQAGEVVNGIGPAMTEMLEDRGGLFASTPQSTLRSLGTDNIPWVIRERRYSSREGFDLMWKNDPWAFGNRLLRLNSSLVDLPVREGFTHPKSKGNTYPKTGDYIVMVGGLPNEDTLELEGTSTISDNNGVHDLLLFAESRRNFSFLHVSMKQAVFGPMAVIPDNKLKHYYCASPRAIDSLPASGKSSKKPFESMTPEEYMAFMSAIATAEEEGLWEHRVEDKEGVPVKFVPTWKDNRTRLTVSKTQGIPFFSDVLRCEVCNGKVLVKLPKDPPFDAVDCPHCDSTATIKTVHLRVDSKRELDKLRSDQ